MTKKKLQLNDVYKKDIRVIMFLFIFGGVTLLSLYLGANEKLAIAFGAVADYIAFRALEEVKNEGYIKVLKGK